jgi:hypothetical protein
MAKTDTDPMGAPLLPTASQGLEQAPTSTAAAPRKALSKREVRALFDDLAENTTAPELRAQAPASEAAEYSAPRPLRVKNPTPLREPPIVIRPGEPDAPRARAPRIPRQLSTTVNTRPFRHRLWVRLASIGANAGLNRYWARIPAIRVGAGLNPFWLRVAVGLGVVLALALGAAKFLSTSPRLASESRSAPSVVALPQDSTALPTSNAAVIPAEPPPPEPSLPSSGAPLDAPKRPIAAVSPAPRTSAVRATVKDAGGQVAPNHGPSDLELGPAMKTSTGKYKEGM